MYIFLYVFFREKKREREREREKRGEGDGSRSRRHDLGLSDETEYAKAAVSKKRRKPGVTLRTATNKTDNFSETSGGKVKMQFH